LAIAALEARGFTAEEFAFSHPGGALGRQLLLRVSDVMVSGAEIPKVSTSAALIDALYEMTEKGLGMTTVVDEHDRLSGVFTDGDLRRAVADQKDLQSTPLMSAMTLGAQTATEEMLAAEAMSIMERHKISALVIVNEQGAVYGVVTLLGLLKAGIS
ncbi:CBS domain-containing protein, partial [Luminiphilus sp.]